MIFTAIIIENEYFVLKQLERLLNSIDEIDLKAVFLNGEDALEFLRKDGSVDIVFSDIEMGDHLGLELAKVFLNYADFLVTAEAIKAQIKQFAQIRNNVLQKKKAQATIDVRNGTTRVVKMLDLEDIFSMVSNENYININTEKQAWLAKNTMKSAEKRFCHTGRFIRISQSVIIATNKLDKVYENRKVVLTNWVEFQISRRYLKQLQDMLSRSNF